MPNPASPSWQVTSTVPFTQFTPGQGPIDGINVNFITSTGITNNVFVPSAQISDTNYVGSLIAAKVAQLHAIHTLTGGSGQ